VTDCSAELTLFSLARKPVVVRDDGGALTSHAGVLLLQVMRAALSGTEHAAYFRTIPDLAEE